jgi:hypothetical protein
MSLPNQQINLGTFNDDSVVRSLLGDAIQKSAKSREQIADEMTGLTGKKISVRMLNDWTAESKENRWPLCYTRAFCAVMNDYRLLKYLADNSGLILVTPEDAELLELGRQYILRKEAERKFSELEISIARRRA